MAQAIRLHTFGGPDVLQLETVAVPPPGPGEVTLRQEAIGVNFIDIYNRTGLYPVPLPSGLGQEAVGIVTAVGPDVAGFKVGDRVAYGGSPVGAYATDRTVAADLLVRLPDGISTLTAAAGLMRGLTAQFLLRQVHTVQPGETILVHAAAGGVGLLLCQWAKALGARVIGVVGNPAKVALAARHGCEHVLVAGQDDVVARVRALTGGEGVPVVYDSVGKDTFMTSLDCLRPLGLMVSYGNSSGPVPPLPLLELAKRGSLFVTRPTLFTFTRQPETLAAMAGDFFARVADGTVRVEIGQQYALADAAQAHEALAARQTTGSTVLLP